MVPAVLLTWTNSTARRRHRMLVLYHSTSWITLVKSFHHSCAWTLSWRSSSLSLSLFPFKPSSKIAVMSKLPKYCLSSSNFDRRSKDINGDGGRGCINGDCRALPQLICSVTEGLAYCCVVANCPPWNSLSILRLYHTHSNFSNSGRFFLL